jgi:hypothetical protein
MWVVQLLTDPVYANESGDQIDCMVTFDNIGEHLPFTANKHDIEPHCVALYHVLVAGNYGPIAPYTPK